MHKFGMPSNAPIKTTPPTANERDGDSRQALRIQVQIAAYLHAADEIQETVITDLSIDGAGLDGAIAISTGDLVEIELINGRRIPGLVIWRLMGSCGIQFSAPLSPNDSIFLQEPQDALKSAGPYE